VLDQLDITQRVALISDGLRDKSDAVKEACITMVKAWVESSGGFENVHSLLNFFWSFAHANF